MERNKMARSKQEVLGELQTFYTAAENGYNLYKDDFHRLLDIYRGELSDDLIKDLQLRGKSHIQYKKARAIVNRYQASVRATYFTNDQFADITANKQTEAAEATAKAKQRIFDFHWKNTIKAYKPFNQCVFDSGLYGTPVAKVYYDSGYDTPKMEHVGIHDIWFDPDAVNIEDAKFIVHKYRKTRQDIAALKKAGVFNSVFKVDELSTNTDTDAIASTDNPYSRITLHDIYYKRNGRWYVSTMHNKSVLLRSDVLLEDGQPFIVGSIMEQAYDDRESAVKIYSDTFLSAIDTMQQEMTTRVNQQLDAIALNINPKWITEKSAGLDDKDLKTGAGRQVSVVNMALMQQIPPPPVPMLNQDIDRLAMQMEESTGIKTLSGQDSALVNRQTAHGMEILSADSNVMVDSYIRSFNETFAEPLIKRMVMLAWKHSRRTELFEGTDRAKNEEFFVSINAGLGSTSKAIKVEGNDKLFQQFMAIQDVDNARQIIKDTLPLYGKKNTTKYFPTDDKNRAAKEEQQQKMMQIEEQKIQLGMADLQAKVKESEAQANMHMANAKESETNAQIKLMKAQAEIELMAKEFSLKQIELEHKMDMELQDFDIKDRDISTKEMLANHSMRSKEIDQDMSFIKDNKEVIADDTI